MSVSGFNQLPAEMQDKIFSELPFDERLKSREVCKDWSEVIGEMRPWSLARRPEHADAFDAWERRSFFSARSFESLCSMSALLALSKSRTYIRLRPYLQKEFPDLHPVKQASHLEEVASNSSTYLMLILDEIRNQFCRCSRCRQKPLFRKMKELQVEKKEHQSSGSSAVRWYTLSIDRIESLIQDFYQIMERHDEVQEILRNPSVINKLALAGIELPKWFLPTDRSWRGGAHARQLKRRRLK